MISRTSRASITSTWGNASSRRIHNILESCRLGTICGLNYDSSAYNYNYKNNKNKFIQVDDNFNLCSTLTIA
jgi:hypothetical protein